MIMKKYIFDLISHFAWTKVYRLNNHHIDHIVCLIHDFKCINNIHIEFPVH